MKLFIKQATRVCAEIGEAVQREGARPRAKVRASEIASEQGTTGLSDKELQDAVDEFLDGLGVGGVGRGVIGLFAGYQGEGAFRRWQLLSAERLARLFGVGTGGGDPPHPDAVVNVEISAQRGISWIGAKTSRVATLQGDLITASIRYSNLPVDAGQRNGLQIKAGRKELATIELKGDSGSVEWILDTSAIEKPESRRTIAFVFGGKTIHSLALDMVCAERRWVVVLGPNVDVFTPIGSPVPDDEIETCSVSGPVTVHVLRFEAEIVLECTLDDEPLELTNTRTNGELGLRSAESIDPTISGSGRRRLRVSENHAEVVIDISSEFVRRGEFTLEDEFRVKLAEGNRHSTALLARIFGGEDTSPYGYLGDVDERSQGRIAFARTLEKDGLTGLPLVVDLKSWRRSSNEPIRHGRVQLQDGLDALPFTADALSPHVETLIGEYHEARRSIQSFFRENYGRSKERPDYAARPVFVAAKKHELEDLIRNYLETYQGICDFLSSGSRQTWLERFVLIGLDCVVNWNAEGASLPLMLIGPWHPLVLAKRYMVQSCLHEAADGFLRKEPAYRYNRLASLLDEVNAVRWLPGLAGSAMGVQAFYVCATSDPGWLVAFSASGQHPLEDLAALVRQATGLEISLAQGGVSRAVAGFVGAFGEAFPSRRAVTVRVASSYSPRQIIESTERFLYEEDASTSVKGARFPGGIHLCFPNEPHDVEELPWRAPPICVYCHGRADECNNVHDIDVDLLSPNLEISFSHVATQRAAPRGRGNLSFALAPLMTMQRVGALPATEIVEGLRGGDDSDLGEGIGRTFLEAALSAEKAIPVNVAAVCRAQLPARPSSLWSILPSAEVDPAALVAYVRESVERRGEPMALWEYRISLSRALDSYYILSKIPSSLAASLNGSPVFSGESQGAAILSELGELGIAVGSEAMRSGKKALGVVGVAGAFRLFQPGKGPKIAALKNDQDHVGFLLPVDSFQELISGMGDEHDGTSFRRADLLACQIYVPPNGGEVRFAFVGVECKYSSQLYPASHVEDALVQARETMRRVRSLAEQGRTGSVERLALLNLVTYGLRITASPDREESLDRKILSSILRGHYEIAQPEQDAILISTECALPRAQIETESCGWWVRICPGHWPGIGNHESGELSSVRKRLELLFSGLSRTRWREEEATAVGATDNDAVEIKFPSVGAHDKAIAGGESNEPAATRLKGDPPPGEGIKFPVGHSIEPFRRDAVYYFHPSNTALTQLNVGIVGDLGTGKTQLTQSLIHNICGSSASNRGIKPRFLIFDYKGDYVSTEFVTAVNATIVEPHRIPLNIFDKSETKSLYPSKDRANFFVDALQKIYGGIGNVQVFNLKKAIGNCYRRAEAGGRDPLVWEIKEEYESLIKTPDSPLSILSDMTEIELFEPDPTKVVPFREFFQGVLVVNLAALGQNDQTKTALVVVFLNLFYDHMLRIEKRAFIGREPQLRAIDSMLLVDEADNIMRYQFPVLRRILLQGREFGVGVLLASQYLSHFKREQEDYTEPLRTWFIHRVPNVTLKELSDLGLPKLEAGVADRIKALKMHQCLFSSYDTPGAFVRGIPFYELQRREPQQ
jgi:DNA phosphorothioation-dependent restriction protein DptH